MSFDKNHQSPDQLVDVRKRTTQVNFVVVIAVLLFFVIGGFVLWAVMKNPPETPPEIPVGAIERLETGALRSTG